MRKNIGLLAFIVLLMPSLAFAFGAIAVDDVKPTEVDSQIVTGAGTKEEVKTLEVDKSSEAGYSIAMGRNSKASAKAEAMKACKEAGNKNCKVVVQFAKCGAYAASASSPSVTGSGTGKTKQKAIDSALADCENCKVIVAECEE
jgi:hypothetical protein